MSEIKKIDIREFLEFGYLQEVNRQFFHPLGLALEVNIDDKTGKYSLGGIWDYRQDPEGIVFGNLASDEATQKAQKIKAEDIRISKTRCELLGFIIQPIGDIQPKPQK